MASDYEKKMLEMRLQLQENQMYMQDAFSDLEKWTQEIKEKEKKIVENPESIKNQNKGLPPIRNLNTKKKKKKRVVTKADANEEKKDKKDTQSKIKGYDYRAWDKLDIDKMCDEVDQQKKSSSDSEYTTDEEWEQEQRLVRADWEKERGNQFFKDNMLDEAIECYTRAINLNPNNAVYVANRAMCYLKQNRYTQAEIDCTLSIALDPNYAKAFHRRGSARVKLGKLEEARADFEQLLKLDPSSKIAQIEIMNIKNAIEKSNLVFPIIKTESQRSKKPLIRVKIEDINVEDASSERFRIQNEMATINSKIKLTEKDQDLFRVDKLQSEKSVKEKIQENVLLESASKKHDDEVKTSLEKTQNAASPVQIVVSSSKVIPNCPNNGYQFKKDWQYLCDNLDNLAAYLKKIEPNEYPKLFLNGLESDHLTKMLEIFNKFFKNDGEVDVFKCVKALTQVKRFQTQLMFLSQSDKQNLNELIAHLRGASDKNQTDIESLVADLKI